MDSNKSKPIARQSSLYSLTFDELQSTLGEPGRDFGSMNMDELLKNIWTTADETQPIMTTEPSSVPGGNLPQRQGSLTLPRTLSQKTVDEVWRNLVSKESVADEVDASERQQTLGEMTLEDFLLRAGLVKYENNDVSAAGFGFEFGQPNQSDISFSGNGMILNQAMQQQQPLQRLPPNIYPKQANVTFSAPVPVGEAGVTVAAASQGNSSADNSTFSSPAPYAFGRGTRSSNTGVEKVVERRQRRMIKNRESAARSRERKQAYTLELEAEVKNLKQLNENLHRKQAEIMKTHKNELRGSWKQRPWLAKMQCLRRTLTGPW